MNNISMRHRNNHFKTNTGGAQAQIYDAVIYEDTSNSRETD